MRGDEYPKFQLFSEHVRGERRTYWIKRQDKYAGRWRDVSEPTTDKRKALRDWDRLAGGLGGRAVPTDAKP